MIELIVLTVVKIVALVVVGGTAWLVIPFFIEDWRNPSRRYGVLDTQQMQEDFERACKRDKQRQALIDQL